MSALTASLILNLPDVNGVETVPCSSLACFEGSYLAFRPSTGYAALWDGTAGDLRLGFAHKAVVAADTEVEIQTYKSGRILTGPDGAGFLVAGMTAQTQCPALVYCTSDNVSADLTLTPTGAPIGRAMKARATGYADVMFLSSDLLVEEDDDPTAIADLAAAGSNQSGAAQIVARITNATGADGTKGVKLPLAVLGDVRRVYNPGSSALLVYPGASDDINDGSTNAAVTLAPKSFGVFTAMDATTWAYSDSVDLRNAQTVVGVKTFSSQPVLSAGAKTDTLSENTTGLGVHVDTLAVQDGRIHEVRTVSAKTTLATLTIAELLAGIVTATHAAGADQAYTLPAGTDCEAARTWANNEAFEWSIVNLSGTPATNTVTITANTGHTIVGPGVAIGSATAELNTRRCITRRTAANTFVTYVF